ncbi:MAG: hypothetical protein KF878_20465 [Planctomycetes bacterium]|nr:hypothetical protein [Planctomycetota bacterium]
MADDPQRPEKGEYPCFPGIPVRPALTREAASGRPSGEPSQQETESSVSFQNDGSSGVTTLRPEVVPFEFGVNKLWLAAGDARSVAYNDLAGGRDGVGEGGAELCFLPGVDEPRLRVHAEVHHPQNIRSAQLELWCKGHPQPIWTKRWGGLWGQGAPIGELITAPPTEESAECAPVAWEGTVEVPPALRIDGQAPFPAGVLTARRSPYQLRLTVSARATPEDSEETDRLGGPVVAWTYLHVAPARLELLWGTSDQLPPLPEPDSPRAKLVDEAERALLEALAADRERPGRKKGDPATAAPRELVRLPLPAHVFECGEDVGSKKGDSELYADLWRDGPRIPLGVRVLFRDVTGAAAECPKALAGATFLWDWEDPAAEDEVKDEDGRVPIKVATATDAFVQERRGYRKGDPGWPAASDNCHVRYGGKRGPGAAPVFPAQAGQAPADAPVAGAFPFQVAAGKRRTWAAVSTPWLTGKHAGASGVVFQPSRMAGDTYRVRVVLDVDGDLDRPELLDPPASRQDASNVFETWKRMEVLYLKRGVPGCDMEAVKGMYQRAGIELVPTVADLDEATWKSAFEAVIAEAPRRSRGSGLLPYLLFFGFHHEVDARGEDPKSAGIHVRSLTDLLAKVQDAAKNGGGIRRLILRNKADAKGFADAVITGSTSGARGIVTRIDEKKGALYVLVVGATAFSVEDVVGEPGTKRARVKEVKAVTGWNGTKNDADRARAISLAQAIDDELADITARMKAGEDLNQQRVALGTRSKTDRTTQEQLDRDIQRRVKKTLMSNPALEREFEYVRRRLAEIVQPGMNGAAQGSMHYAEVLKGAVTGETLLSPVMRRYVDEAAAARKPDRSPKDLVTLFHFKRSVSIKKQLAEGASVAADNVRARAQVYLATFDPASNAMKGQDAVAAHELGHALFLQHAPPEGKASEEVASHAPGDPGGRCLMNYELDTTEFCGLCALRLAGWKVAALEKTTPARREQYRVSLRLGRRELDDLFAHAEGDDVGCMERLQALGLFRRPLSHPEAKACYEVVWRHCKEQLYRARLADAGEDEVDDRLAALLADELPAYLVDGGELPEKGKFAKLRIDGTYTSFYHHLLEEDMPFQQASDRYEVEALFLRDNPALGKLPIVAAVEVKDVDGSDADWAPARDVSVHLQLVKPDTLPVFQAPRDPAAPGAAASRLGRPRLPGEKTVAGAKSKYLQVVAPARTGGPDEFLRKRVHGYKDDDPADPQAGNAHFDLGGKRKMFDDGRVAGERTWRAAPKLRQDDESVRGRVLWTWGVGRWESTPGDPPKYTWRDGPSDEYTRPNVFATGAVPGITGAHEDEDRTPSLADYPEAEAVPGAPHSVQARTNLRGEACFVFMPSTVGGDRYKLRAFVGAPTLGDSTGADPAAGAVETGTMVRWRTLRLSRYIQQRPPAVGALDATARATLERHQKVDTAFSQGAIDDIDFAGEVTLEYAKAYCELLIEPLAEAPEQLDAVPGADAAYAAAIAAAQQDQALAHLVFAHGATQWGEPFYSRWGIWPEDRRRAPSYDWNALTYWAPASPYTFNLRDLEEYNRAKGDAFDAILRSPASGATPEPQGWEVQLLERVLMDVLLPAFLKALGDNQGFYPGLMAFQGAKRHTWEDIYSNLLGKVQLGKAKGPGAFLWGGVSHRSDARCYDLAAHAMHELGHCQFRLHAYPTPEHADAQRVLGYDTHDLDALAQAKGCLMGYGPTPGDDHCGHCLAAFMGVDTFREHFRAPRKHGAFEKRLRFSLVHPDGTRCAGEPWRVEDDAGAVVDEGVLDARGEGEVVGVAVGEYHLIFPLRDASAWEPVKKE